MKNAVLPKRVAAIHDLSGFGRCSLAVIMPVLSAMGVQVCPFPTAVLSTHTGGFSGFTCRNLTDDLQAWTDHWVSLSLHFDAVYTGWLGSPSQIGLVDEAIRRLRAEHAWVLVDPVLGDDGALYSTCTEKLVSGMRALTKKADLITPNLTEAAFLLEEPLPAHDDLARLTDWASRLSEGRRAVVLTGVRQAGRIGALSVEPGGAVSACFSREIHRVYPGTGDLFASVLLGSLLKGRRLERAVRAAVDFTALCATRTARLGTPEREGVALEPLLGRLARRA